MIGAKVKNCTRPNECQKNSRVFFYIEKLRDSNIRKSFEQTVSNGLEAYRENLNERRKHIEITVIRVAKILKLEWMKDRKHNDLMKSAKKAKERESLDGRPQLHKHLKTIKRTTDSKTI